MGTLGLGPKHLTKSRSPLHLILSDQKAHQTQTTDFSPSHGDSWKRRLPNAVWVCRYPPDTGCEARPVGRAAPDTPGPPGGEVGLEWQGDLPGGGDTGACFKG